MDRLAEGGAIPVHKLAANLKLGSGLMPMREMLDRNIVVALGVDGACSSDNQNVFDAIKLDALIHNVKHHDPREGSGYDARFVPNDDAPAVVRCLNLYAGGLTYDSAAARLNAEGVPFRGRDGRPKRWGRESVRTVVGNVLHYVGYHVPNTGWDAKTDRIKLAGPEMGDYVDRWAAMLGARPSSAITPVIDRELANAVIERRYRNQYVGRPPKDRPYLLTPIVFWQGQRLHGRTRHYGRFYATRSEDLMLDANRAESSVLSKLTGLQFPPDTVKRVRELLMARVDADRLAALQARIEDAKRKLSMLADLYLDKRISREDYERKFAEFNAELQAAEAELAQPVEVERAMRMLGDLGGMIGQMTPEAQKRNLHRIFTRIELNDQGEAVRVEVKPWVMRAFEPMLGSTPVYYPYYAEGGSRTQFFGNNLVVDKSARCI